MVKGVMWFGESEESIEPFRKRKKKDEEIQDDGWGGIEDWTVTDAIARESGYITDGYNI